MTYTQIALAAAIGAVILDLFILRTRVLKLGVWWVSYAIVIGFQFITNGTLTGFVGFAMCLSAVVFWVYIGSKGIQRVPVSNTSVGMRERFKFLK